MEKCETCGAWRQFKEPGQRLPADTVARGLALAKGAVIFDVPMMELTREEAIAVAAFGWQAEREARDTARHEREFLEGR